MSEEDLNQLKEETQFCKNELTHIKTDICEVREMMQQVDHAIRGNGQPGLSQRVGLLEAAQKSRVQLITLGAAIIGAATALASLFMR